MKPDFIYLALCSFTERSSLFHFAGEPSYSTLVWEDTEQAPPTEQEVLAKAAELEADWNAKEYQRKRALEYPPVTDYLDAVVKGDQQQMQAYIDACLAVKAKYPKP